MSRIKRGVTSRAKHKKLLKLTKGYRATKSKLVKVAREAALHAGQYAYHGRKLRKRNIRREWIVRISEATKSYGLPYNRFISGLKQANITLDRKILADMVVNDPETFKSIVDRVQKTS